MMKFLKGLYRIFCYVREFTVSLVFILFVMAFFSFVALLSGDKNSKATENAQYGALTLNLEGYLADNQDDSGELRRLVQSELGQRSEPMKISTFNVVQAIRKAAKDPAINGIVLDLRYFTGGDLPSLTYVGTILQEFKASKKPVIAIGEMFTQKQFYLASFADNIYLNKSGFVELNGLSYSNLYFKSLFEKIEAVPHIFRVGSYKSAVEPFIRDEMSPEAKANATLWLNTLWQNMQSTMMKNRQIARENLLPSPEKWLEQYRAVKGDDAQFALQQGWVSEVLSTDEMVEKLAAQFGKDEKTGYASISYVDYEQTLPSRFANHTLNDKIAVINIEGEIVWGEGDEGSAGSDQIVQQLQQARKDDRIKGVILRINSPGGSAVASELIRQAAENVQKAGKPVVASMGGMAASGGYWIAATSDKIVAAPTTLTGSIGIFGLMMNVEKTAQKVGIREDGVYTSPLAQQSALKPLDRTRAELIQISIEHGYDRFLDLVATGRKMSKAQVERIAQGQVWLGETAFTHGLVDQLGDFDDAYDVMVTLINAQRQAHSQENVAGLDVLWLGKPEVDFLSQMIRELKLSAHIDLPLWMDASSVTKWTSPLDFLKKFNDPKQSYLYCLNCGTVN